LSTNIYREAGKGSGNPGSGKREAREAGSREAREAGSTGSGKHGKREAKTAPAAKTKNS